MKKNKFLTPILTPLKEKSPNLLENEGLFVAVWTGQITRLTVNNFI